MLLRFSVTNHLSLRDRQELSLVVSSLKDAETGLIECDAAPTKRLLPAAVIYGANASGKSNVVGALRWMRSQIGLSYRRAEPSGGVSRSPFALDPAYAEAPSTFEVDFVVEGVRYQYGFTACDEAFTAEWLNAFPNGRRQMLFERECEQFSFGRALRGRNKVIADITRPNSLFLSAAAQNDHKELFELSLFLGSSLFERWASRRPSRLSFRGNIDRRTIKFLSNIGTGVVDYRLRDADDVTKFDVQQLILDPDSAEDVYKSFRRHVAESRVLELAHLGKDDSLVYFTLDQESDGTQRLLALMRLVFRALDEGTLLVVDELDASLHTQACEAVLALFASHKTNTKGAQLIATTHDTNLLHSSLLRRDQVWFTEKDTEGATHLYPLTDIYTRKDDNIEKGYLQGRFGAVPFAGKALDFIIKD